MNLNDYFKRRYAYICLAFIILGVATNEILSAAYPWLCSQAESTNRLPAEGKVEEGSISTVDRVAAPRGPAVSKAKAASGKKVKAQTESTLPKSKQNQSPELPQPRPKRGRAIAGPRHSFETDLLPVPNPQGNVKPIALTSRGAPSLDQKTQEPAAALEERRIKALEEEYAKQGIERKLQQGDHQQPQRPIINSERQPQRPIINNEPQLQRPINNSEPQAQRPLPITAKDKFLIPYVTGLGVNNQMWDFEAAAMLAKATDRVLCLAPFLRFYLSVAGQPNIPFNVLFDPAKFDEYTRVSEIEDCHKACGGAIHTFYSLRSSNYPAKKGKELTHISAFKRNTNFRKGIPEHPKLIVDASFSRVDTYPELTKLLTKHVNPKAKCVGMLGATPTALGKHETEVIRKLWISSPMIKHGATLALDTLFDGEPFVAVHWRFEETKCRDVGSLLPEDRARKPDYDQKAMSIAKRVNITGDGPFCLFSLRGSDRKLVTVSQEVVARLMNDAVKAANAKRLFFATDVNPVLGEEMLKYLRKETGMKMLADLPAGWNKDLELYSNQGDVMSRLEQEICSRSAIYVGTSTSSWTSTVVNLRTTLQKSANDTMLDWLADDFFKAAG